ncbi:DUF6766 family protein [Arthrobacter pityocampae]|uniref:DUF6766 family protein n=1 Tax=Arthrobacter pityocampae TaxID=547334 RepID=UPI0037361F3A
MKTLKNNGLFLVFFSLFLLSLIGQAFSGVALFNEEQTSSGLEEITFWQYVGSSSFAVDVSENWQSEFLQFLLLILAAVWFVQKGSPESKKLGDRGPESDQDQLLGAFAQENSPLWARVGGWRTTLYSNSLAAVMGAIFMLSWLAQSIAGFSAAAEQRLADLQDPGTWADYVSSPEFWSRTLQNWQSEFLAVASMVILSVYLRQRGSPESKPVGAPHDATDVEG